MRRYSSPCAQSPRCADRSVEYDAPGGTMGGEGEGCRQLRTGAAQQARTFCVSSLSPLGAEDKAPKPRSDASARLDLGRTQRIRPRLRANRTRLKWPRLRASAGPVAHATHSVSRVSGDHIQPAHTQTRRPPRITRRRTPVPWRWTLEKESPVLTRRPPFEKGRRASAGGREHGWARACHFLKCCSKSERRRGWRVMRSGHQRVSKGGSGMEIKK